MDRWVGEWVEFEDGGVGRTRCEETERGEMLARKRMRKKGRTHHTACKRKQHAQRIQRRDHHPSQRGHEPCR